MRPTLAQVSTLNSGFAVDVEQYAAGQCRSIELWLTKLEDYLRTRSVDDVRRLLDRFSVAAPVASFQGGLLVSQGEARRESWELCERRLDLCRQLGVETMVVACDVARAPQESDLERIQFSLLELSRQGERRGVRVALEFQANAAFGNNLQTAAAQVAEVGSPYLGLCFDAFHYYVGPSKPEDLGHLHAQNLFHVQLCDLADVPRELARDAHRILPGEGDIPMQPILERLHAIDYHGCVSIELLNPHIWQVGPRQFGEIAMTALRKLLGQSSMD